MHVLLFCWEYNRIQLSEELRQDEAVRRYSQNENLSILRDDDDSRVPGEIWGTYDARRVGY